MIKILLLLISILLIVALTTLLERKILSYSQERKGPNLVGPLGILQPFSDGLKLLSKEQVYHSKSHLVMATIPLFFFFLSLLTWSLWAPGIAPTSNFYLIVLAGSGLGALAIFLAGWGGVSAYSLMGGVRASAQMISYEVVFSFILILPLLFSFSYNLSEGPHESAPMVGGGTFFLWVLPTAIVVLLAETNRAPFDLTEGESELVSGFNTEYSSVAFVFLFLGEYSMIFLFSTILSVAFFGSWIGGLGILILIIWVRSCYPRKRYDHLMSLMWVHIFPMACMFLGFSTSVLLL